MLAFNQAPLSHRPTIPPSHCPTAPPSHRPITTQSVEKTSRARTGARQPAEILTDGRGRRVVGGPRAGTNDSPAAGSRFLLLTAASESVSAGRFLSGARQLGSAATGAERRRSSVRF